MSVFFGVGDLNVAAKRYWKLDALIKTNIARNAIFAWIHPASIMTTRFTWKKLSIFTKSPLPLIVLRPYGLLTSFKLCLK